MTKAKYIGPSDPDYRFGEVYEIRKIKGVPEQRAIAAKSVYGDFYAMPAELFAPSDFVAEKPKLFITKSQRELLISEIPAAAELISQNKLEELLDLLKQTILDSNGIDPANSKQHTTKEKLQELYQRLLEQN